MHEKCFEFCFVDKRSVCCFFPSETSISHPAGANPKAAAGGAWLKVPGHVPGRGDPEREEGLC